MTYTFYFPENGKRVSNAEAMEFISVSEAIEYWERTRPGWERIEPGSEKTKAAFLNHLTGEIVVIKDSDKAVCEHCGSTYWAVANCPNCGH